MSKLDIVNISYACVLVLVCLACVFVRAPTHVCTCICVYMCVNSSKKVNLYEKCISF